MTLAVAAPSASASGTAPYALVLGTNPLVVPSPQTGGGVALRVQNTGSATLTGPILVTVSGMSPAGFTIGSFTSVSLDPPLVAFLPQINSDTWEAMAPGGTFCVNVLRDDQADLCWRFAKSGVGDDRFDSVVWSTSPTGCPIIEGVGAWIDCTIEHSLEFGDHFLVVGRVVDLSHHDEPHVPLVFYKGALGGFLEAE
jgi:flavin reductase (DIM6/NTAB) family NADH-FMN oxidoreductase RutF